MRYCCSRCAMSSSVDSVSPRRDFFMNNAYEGTAMETRMDTMATATMSSMSVMPRMRLRAVSAVRQVPGRYMSVSSLHYAGAIPPEFTPLFCARIEVPEGFRWTVEADRPEAPTLVRGAEFLVNCARFLPSECD